MTAIGVDGAPGGWVHVTLESGTAVAVGFATRLADLPRADIVGIDIPLGFPVLGQHRPAEVEARRLL
ncbi:MAG: DUF429 domain-containing protein, partial [Acidimicrobiia bacterium]